MLGRFRIRSLIYFGVVMLSVIVISLATVSLIGVGKFKKLTKDTRLRATELPLSANLNTAVSELRSTLWQCRSDSVRPWQIATMQIRQTDLREQFIKNVRMAGIVLDQYRQQLETPEEGDPRIVDTSEELQLVKKMQNGLTRISGLINSRSLDLDNYRSIVELDEDLSDELESLQNTANSLPSLLNDRFAKFAEEARTEYRTLIGLATFTGFSGLVLLIATAWILNSGILRPLRQLIRGAAVVADGRYDYRIHVAGCPEMVHLASAFNHMTESFRQISDNLTDQVEARSRELIRSEQLASVGMLAAGVAHEINNPLASIAWSAEALESRLDELNGNDNQTLSALSATSPTIRKYLKRIQDEAFRCKKITTGLLDFSRLGDAKKSSSDIREIVVSSVDMVQTVGGYGNRKVIFAADKPVWCVVHPQEIRQVILNLLTNALESTSENGQVVVSLSEVAGEAVVEVTDNGCGMTPEVMQNLFEPFFTNRRDGKGTGLGLAIAWRIVDEHGGQIHVSSDGPGKGSQFQLCLPLKQQQQGTIDEQIRPAA